MQYAMRGLNLVNIAQTIFSVKNQIHEYEALYGRAHNSIELLAVSKTQPIEKIQQAIAVGQMAFGENYLQESLKKITALAEKNVVWHFIGRIQHNKTKKIAEHFAWVHSVSNLEIAKHLNNQRPAHLPPLNICLQINISAEQTKAGIDPNEALSLAEGCSVLPKLTLRGLMAIPAPKDSFDEQRAEFRKLRLIYDNLNTYGFKLDTLSMGMSHDMEAAIAEGATLVRIGTAIFGERI